ncbi:MAG: IclR family transcriptional regulator [Glaciihabitans sp.]|jgi:DNA-binding IclR family transcriptional regulator|nr:IclR family transcriptional regulator [Glaciihabitans sp.]MDQ1572134.1 IclR family transcriptional regulator, acetate operon repressor [Actinomycetota bacterium]
MTVDSKLETPDVELPDRLVGADRVLSILVELSRHANGIGLDDLARVVDSPKPTVHRALAALRRAGLAAQDGPGHYVLGDEFVRMAFAHHEARPDHIRVRSILSELATRYLETAHFAVLEGKSIVYRAKVDPPHGAVKLTSTVGGRNPAHATAVGKMLLSYTLLDEASVRAWIGNEPLLRRTPKTIVTARELHDELTKIRNQGFSVDDQENELQINCVALPVFLTSPTVPSGAISISAMAYRTPLQTLIDDVPRIRAIAAEHGLETAVR